MLKGGFAKVSADLSRLFIVVTKQRILGHLDPFCVPGLVVVRADPGEGSEVVLEIIDGQMERDTVLRAVLSFVRVEGTLGDETSPGLDDREKAGLDGRHFETGWRVC